ncbi:glycosyltransferase family 4 protein [Alkaliphilus sp. B6464]|uniref:glycosyltransferase family 4 protein n=1 Tax=Alkaliphilus sp. B6464 TaxID=2731219 RepID=UPI001BA78146|nr:glycosyltransferase family 4 protein [Alkaliphilus sp. B6464]QUH19068.1 glycosyltransferase family 4 protein [Alkaliphilus sp. B6464]
MKDILFITHFTQVPGEHGNGRFHYIADQVGRFGHKVEVITSSFSHQKKQQRIEGQVKLKNSSYKLTMVHEIGYKKNVSFSRFYSHYVMGLNLKKYLLGREKPDVIYCSVPTLDVAKIAAEYAKKNEIKFIIDIQDLWPEAFKMLFNTPIISNILFYPMQRCADYIYRAADEIIAVSNTYLDRALQVNKKCKNGKSIYLGTELELFDRLSHGRVNKLKGEIWLAYIGTLGHSYEIELVIDSLSMLSEKGIKNIKFIIMGDGPLKQRFEDYAKEQNTWVEFMGRLQYEKMVGILASCDIAINPIKAGSAGSIINKVGDYAAAGVPVLNTQECEEYRNLIEEYEAGFNCINGNAIDVANKLMILVNDQKRREEMGRNNRRMAEDKFDRKKTYQDILKLFEI